MKNYHFELSEHELKLFFPEERVKDKIKVIEILLEATRFILYSEQKKHITSSNGTNLK